MLPEHLHCSSFEGALFDTRQLNWSYKAPLRPIYRQMHSSFPTGAHLRATLRAMPYMLHDGDCLAILMDDGEILCHACACLEIRSLLSSIRDKRNDGWRPVGWTTCYSGESEIGDCCAHCNAQLSEGTESLCEALDTSEAGRI